jgi:hypothetical protein
MSDTNRLPAFHPRDQIVTQTEIEELGLEIAPADIGPSDDEAADVADENVSNG